MEEDAVVGDGYVIQAVSIPCPRHPGTNLERTRWGIFCSSCRAYWTHDDVEGWVPAPTPSTVGARTVCDDGYSGGVSATNRGGALKEPGGLPITPADILGGSTGAYLGPFVLRDVIMYLAFEDGTVWRRKQGGETVFTRGLSRAAGWSISMTFPVDQVETKREGEIWPSDGRIARDRETLSTLRVGQDPPIPPAPPEEFADAVMPASAAQLDMQDHARGMSPILTEPVDWGLEADVTRPGIQWRRPADADSSLDELMASEPRTWDSGKPTRLLKLPRYWGPPEADRFRELVEDGWEEAEAVIEVEEEFAPRRGRWARIRRWLAM